MAVSTILPPHGEPFSNRRSQRKCQGQHTNPPDFDLPHLLLFWNLRDPIMDVIRIESAKLREKWMTFYQKTPRDERLDLDSFKPTIQGVTAIVDAVTAQWQDKRKQGRSGKAKSLFHRFCSTLDSHSSLIELLPDGNEYVSIFTGALNAIIKVDPPYSLLLLA